MALHTFGTDVDSAAFIELPDGSTNPPPRPDTAYPLLVQLPDGTDLAPTTIEALTGYWSYQTTDQPIILVSADGGVEYHEQHSLEGRRDAMSAGANASAALTAATQANIKAQQALDAANQGGVTFTDVDGTVFGPSRQFTFQQIGVREVGVPLSVDDFADLAEVAKTNNGADLNDFGNANGVAPLGADGRVPSIYLPGSLGGAGELVIDQNNDVNGTFPARTTVTSDPTLVVVYNPWWQFDKRPPIGTDLATAYAMDPANGIPGDEVKVFGPGS